METRDFDTDVLPAAERLIAFRAGAVDFQVDAVGDPLAFSARWRLLTLGDLNAIHAHITPVRYRRDLDMIRRDGEDRVAIHCYARGSSRSVLDGQVVETGAGEAQVWDLTRAIDSRGGEPLEVFVVTMPRYMLDEVLWTSSYSGVLRDTPELAMAIDHLRHVIDHASDWPDTGATYLGRAIRDLFAVAMLPTFDPPGNDGRVGEGPLFRRLCELLDTSGNHRLDEAMIARALDVSLAELRRTADQFGGLTDLIERRRLLYAYRLLCDPEEVASVSTIAWRCGFADPARFSRRFRAVFHASPTDLRHFRRGRLPDWAGAYHIERNYRRLIAS